MKMALSGRQKPKFLTFVITLFGLYLSIAWVLFTIGGGFVLLQPQAQPLTSSQGLTYVYPMVVYVTEWWQYLFFGLYNVAVWVGAYFIAARIVPRFFS